MHALVALTIAALVMVSAPARAQGTPPFDHLKCHTVKDKTHFVGSVDLDALQPDFSDTGCKLVGQAKYFCVPVTKKNVQPPPPRPDVVGQTLQVDFTCYKLKCPIKPPDHDVVDQFGYRHQSKYKTDLLCVPTLKGCQSTGPHMCGGGCPIAGEVCLPNPLDICVCQKTTTTVTTSTSTTTSTTLPPCVTSSFPTCPGTCPAPKICVKDVTTTVCVCCGLGGAPCTVPSDCCGGFNCVAGTCQ